jgi:hypothetical protein
MFFPVNQQNCWEQAIQSLKAASLMFGSLEWGTVSQTAPTLAAGWIALMAARLFRTLDDHFENTAAAAGDCYNHSCC